MYGGEELFEDIGSKDGKKKMEKDTLEINIKLNKRVLRWIERSIFILVIIVLAVLVYYSPFCDVKCEKGLSEITSTPVVSEPEISTEPEIEEEPVVEGEFEHEPEHEPELSGEVTLTIDTIKLDVNKTRVESITVKIDNQKKIFTPLLYIYWYDKDSVEAIKVNPNGGKINFTGPIPVGKVSVKKIDDELENHYLRVDDKKRELFKIELYDRSDKTLLDTKTKTVATD